jgi:hypothetical protein
MKHMYVYAVAMLLALGTYGSVFAQSDTLDVPASTAVGHLTNVILGDTTASGARVNLNRVYRLQRASIYWIGGQITTKGWDLRIVGVKENPATPTYPPIIAYGVLQDGSTAPRIASVDGNLVLKNLFISGVDPKNVIKTTAFEVYRDSAQVTIDNCKFEWHKVRALWVHAKYTSVTITNSHFRNVTNNTGPFNGRLMSFDDLETNRVIMQNNTFVNHQSYLFANRFNKTSYFKFDHNTVVNTVKWPFHNEHWSDAEITNNIFYNTSSYGETNVDASNQDLQGIEFGIVNVPPDTALIAGVSPTTRKVVLRNNLFFFDTSITNWQAKYAADADPVRISPWMNTRTQAKFDDNATYPNLEGQAPITENPSFTNVPPTKDMIAYMEARRKNTTSKYWGWDPDSVMIANPWPLPEKLDYPTSKTAYTAADGGFPLGDLNWFPAKKAQWDVLNPTAVDADPSVPAEFSLEQNYPNPFNPATTITFNLPQGSPVRVRVFSILGEEVATLVNGSMTAGQHQVTFDAGTHGSGVYIYQLEAGRFVSARKMMFIK